MPFEPTDRQQAAVDHALMTQSVKEIADRLEALEKSVEGLVSAWEAAGALVSFVKWAAIVVSAVTGVVGIFRYGIPHK